MKLVSEPSVRKNILEPVFEADFYPCSYGFRPGRSAHAALEELRMLLLPKCMETDAGTEIRFPYQWAIEGDIKGCFDNIDHHALMSDVERALNLSFPLAAESESVGQ